MLIVKKLYKPCLIPGKLNLVFEFPEHTKCYLESVITYKREKENGKITSISLSETQRKVGKL